MYSYIHIPFCSSKCKYCHFASFVAKEEQTRYFKKLLSDIQGFSWKKEVLSSIYFWWGTPSSVENHSIKKIIDTLKEEFSFAPSIEITLEANPQDITQEKLDFYFGIWINRLSLWVQSLHNKTLKEIGRNNAEITKNALFLIEKSNFENISLDFIIGLPYQKKWELKKDIDFILKSYKKIKHISCYMLEDYYYPQAWKNISLKEEEFLWEYSAIKKILAENKMYPYELSNFSKKWFECKHNKAYWNHQEVLAFWLSAHGFLNGKRYHFPEKFLEYYKWTFFEELLSEKDIVIEKILFSLRTTGIKKDLLPFLDKKKIKEFINWNYLEEKEEKLILTKKGIMVIDTILAEIIL